MLGIGLSAGGIGSGCVNGEPSGLLLKHGEMLSLSRLAVDNVVSASGALRDCHRPAPPTPVATRPAVPYLMSARRCESTGTVVPTRPGDLHRRETRRTRIHAPMLMAVATTASVAPAL